MVKFGIQTILPDGTPAHSKPPARGVFLVRAGYVVPR